MAKALYTQYRPNNFKDVIGQDHIVSVLHEAVSNGDIAHAYLFSGSRGTGKTSVARILAKSIGTSTDDLYEIDAASNTSVEDVRELNESVNTLPFSSKFKVYILDEVHMLSKSAFNALLKTLEEPPEHVIFILATTEPHKLPDTVVSRCEPYTFRRPTQSILRDFVKKVAQKEEYKIEDAAADLVALIGDGSFRDTLGILQKVMKATKGKNIKHDLVEEITDSPSHERVNEYLRALADRDIEPGLQAIQKVVDANKDVTVFTKLILEKLRAILLMKIDPKREAQFKEIFTKEDVDFLKKMAEEKADVFTSDVLGEHLNVFNSLQGVYMKHVPLELALIDSVRHND